MPEIWGRNSIFFAENLILRKTQSKIEFRFFSKYSLFVSFFRRLIEDSSKYIYQWKPKIEFFEIGGSRKPFFFEIKTLSKETFFSQIDRGHFKVYLSMKIKNQKKKIFFTSGKGGVPLITYSRLIPIDGSSFIERISSST
jgi:hypothetical protein